MSDKDLQTVGYHAHSSCYFYKGLLTVTDIQIG